MKRRLGLLSRLLTTVLVLLLLPTIPSIPAHATNPSSTVASIYLDAPTVQGSFAGTHVGSLTETFDTQAQGPCSASSVVGTISPTSGCLIWTEDPYFGGATTISSDPTTGGTHSAYASTGVGEKFTITFNSPQRYIGFWWSAGNSGNAVTVFSGGAAVAQLDVNDVFNKIQSGQVITADDNITTYNTNDYLGHPADRATYDSGEPFTYVHMFAGPGQTFDAITLVGRGFEFDNLTISPNAETPLSRLVKVTDIYPIQWNLNFDSQGGTPLDAVPFYGGDSISAPTPPVRTESRFMGWYTASGYPVTFPYRPANGSETLYAHWGIQCATNTFPYSRIDGGDRSSSPIYLTPQGNLVADGILTGDDNYSDPVDIGFSINGSSQNSQMQVGVNGWVTLDDKLILVLASDLQTNYPDNTCDLTSNFVSYGETQINRSKAFVVTWYKISPYNDSSTFGTFQIAIVKSGNSYQIIRNYESINRIDGVNAPYLGPIPNGFDYNWDNQKILDGIDATSSFAGLASINSQAIDFANITNFDDQGPAALNYHSHDMNNQLGRYIYPDGPYTVTYVYNGASANNSVTSSTYSIGGSPIMLPNPLMGGSPGAYWAFSGWYFDSALTYLAGLGNEYFSPNSNIILYAKWTPTTRLNTHTQLLYSSENNSDTRTIYANSVLHETATVTQLEISGTPIIDETGTVSFSYYDSAGVENPIAGCESVAISAGIALCSWTPQDPQNSSTTFNLFARYAPIPYTKFAASEAQSSPLNTHGFTPWKSVSSSFTFQATSISLSSGTPRITQGQAITETATVTTSGGSPTLLPNGNGFVEFAYFDASNLRFSIPACSQVPLVNGVAVCSWVPTQADNASASFKLYANFLPAYDSVFIASDNGTSLTAIPSDGFTNYIPTITSLTKNNATIAQGVAQSLTAKVRIQSSLSDLPSGQGHVEFRYFIDRTTSLVVVGCGNVAVETGTASCNWTPTSSLNLPGSINLYADYMPCSTAGCIYSASDTLTASVQTSGFKNTVPTNTELNVDSASIGQVRKISYGQIINLNAKVTQLSSGASIPDGNGLLEFYYVSDTGTAVVISGCERVEIVSAFASCSWVPISSRNNALSMAFYADFIPEMNSIYAASDILRTPILTMLSSSTPPIRYTVRYSGNGNTAGDVPIDFNSPYETSTVISILGNTRSLTKDGFTFQGWSTQMDGSGQTYQAGDVIGGASTLYLYAKWRLIPQTSLPQSSYVAPQYPGVTWSPSNMVEGDLVSTLSQLNAQFSVPGTSKYSIRVGFKPSVGNLLITVEFTPSDALHFYSISTTRTIQVLAAATPTPTATAIAASPTPTPSISPKPILPNVKPATVLKSELKYLGAIYFNNNEYFLDATDISKIKEISLHIHSLTTSQVIVMGNTDIKAGVDNIWLSKARAEAVAKLTAKYVKKVAITSAWYASKRPIAIGIDKASLAKNRRVEIYAVVKVSSENSQVAADIAPKNISNKFSPITFNMNEYFLDAADRKTLMADAIEMSRSKCLTVTLVGTSDQKKGGLSDQLGTLRAEAVKKFLSSIYGGFRYKTLSQSSVTKREVRISCTN